MPKLARNREVVLPDNMLVDRHQHRWCKLVNKSQLAPY